MRRTRGPRPGRPTRYAAAVVRALRAIWTAAGYPWSRRLNALLPIWLPWALDFPFLDFHRPLWDVVVIVLSIGGTILSLTTMLPAWRRLKRHGRALRAWQQGTFAAPAPVVERPV